MKKISSIFFLVFVYVALSQAPKIEIENATTINNKEVSQANVNEDDEKVSQQDKRLAACITLFYSQKKKDEAEWQKFKAYDGNITKGRNQKIQALMIEKCNKTLPDSAVTSVISKIFIYYPI